MAVPVGVSVGDFILVGKIAGNVIKELKKNSEAATKYQNLLIELEAFHRALVRLDILKPTQHDLVHLDAVRAASQACRRPLEAFLEKIKNDDDTMGVEKAKKKRYKGVAKRLEFNMRLGEDVKELRVTLTNHASTINMLLLEQTINTFTNAEIDSKEQTEKVDQITEKLEILAAEIRVSRGQREQRETNAMTGESSSRLITYSNDHSSFVETSDTASAEDLAISLLEADDAIMSSGPRNDFLERPRPRDNSFDRSRPRESSPCRIRSRDKSLLRRRPRDHSLERPRPPGSAFTRRPRDSSLTRKYSLENSRPRDSSLNGRSLRGNSLERPRPHQKPDARRSIDPWKHDSVPTYHLSEKVVSNFLWSKFGSFKFFIKPHNDNYELTIPELLTTSDRAELYSLRTESSS